jgi:hypothetical protein
MPLWLQGPAAAAANGVSTETPASIDDIKQSLAQSLEGIDRGIFGVQVLQHAWHATLLLTKQPAPVTASM